MFMLWHQIFVEHKYDFDNFTIDKNKKGSELVGA